MDFLFPMKAKLSGTAKNCTITNFSGGQILVMTKNIRKQNHLGLNNMLFNYYRWRQIIHCKRFSYHQWAQMSLVSNKNYIIGFSKRNYFDQWKAYCRKRVIYAPKTCCLIKFYTPFICVIWNWSIVVFTVVSRPELLYIPSAIRFTNLNFAECKFT